MAFPNSVPFLDMYAYKRAVEWHSGATWGLNKSVVQVNQTALPDGFLDRFKTFLRVDHSDEDALIKLEL